MKRILLITLLFISSTVLAQESKICGHIDYVQTTHFSKVMHNEYRLSFNNEQSIYIESDIAKKKEKMEQINKDEGQQFNRYVPRNNLTPQFYYNDRKSFYFMEIFFDQELLVKEDSFVWKWNLEDEQKKIGDFLCQKATIYFRGRNYTAWFTEEIPVSFGPWKFQGTPGLILEINEDDGVLHIIAKNIKIESKQNCKITVDKSKFDSALTIEQYLDKQVELLNEDLAKLSSRLPKGFGPLKIAEDCDDCSEHIEFFNKKQ